MRSPSQREIYLIETLRSLLFEAALRYSDKPALKSKKHGEYQSLTYRRLRDQVEQLATAFFALGLTSGDRVGVLSENRMEWCVAYLAAVTSGLVAVPVDRDLKRGEIRHVLDFARTRLLVASADYVRLLRDERPEMSFLESVISMEDERGSGDLSIPEALERGRRILSEGDYRYQKVSVGPQDLAAIIFTSGTMGSSKGVMLTHENIAFDVLATSKRVVLREDDVVLSVLPLHHTYECTAGFLTALYQGATVCHAESLRKIPENLQETRASVMLGVPLLLETIYRRIEGGIRERGEARFRFAKWVARFAERAFRVNLRRKIFRRLHERFGGRLRLLISGGAAINPDVSRGYRELGIDFIQGYGMTEASPIISVNQTDRFKDASVGLPLPGVEVRIEEDGEILVRGPNVMKGYYQNERATQETLRDGWLHTGDLGWFDEDGFLYIGGRKKSVIVTPNGKNVYPEEVESVLNQSPYVLESLVWGGPERDPTKVEVQAIIVPHRETFDAEFGQDSYDEDRIRETIAAEVKRLCRQMAQYKRVKRFTVRLEEFEKTTTRKIKRYLYTGKPQAVSVAGKGEEV